MTVLSLEVGETYTTRNGRTVRIVSELKMGWDNWNPFHKFRGSNGEIYKTNGRTGFIFTSPLDIVEVSSMKMFGFLDDYVSSLGHTLK